MVAMLFLFGFDAKADFFYVQFEKVPGIFLWPKTSQETPQEAISNYIAYIRTNKKISEAFPGQSLETLKIKQILNKNMFSSNSSLLLVANRAYDQVDLTRNLYQQRIERIERHINGAVNTFILPLAAFARFQPSIKYQLYKDLSEEVTALMSLGGADIDPSHYFAPMMGARNTNEEIDFHELDLVKNWLSFKNKPLFGICRGFQLMSVAMGFKLKQHIEGHGDGSMTTHQIIDYLPHLPKAAEDVRQQQEPPRKLVVLSAHHQEVDYNGAPEDVRRQVLLKELGEDGTVESLIHRLGHIWGVQYHPELMEGQVPQSYFSQLIEIIKKSQIFSDKRARTRKASGELQCGKIFSK